MSFIALNNKGDGMQVLTLILFLAVVTGVLKLVSMVVLQEIQLHASVKNYFDTHLPISDEEFLELCDPEIKPEVALKVREILAYASGVEKELIYPEARLIADLGMY
jgi:hypothetical protein